MKYTQRSVVYLLFTIVFGFILFFVDLNARHFWGTTEGRTGQIVKEMLQTGDWVIPRLNDEPRLTKPPLYFWSAAIVSVLFNDGKVSEWTVRLPSSVSALLVLIMTFLIGFRLYGDRVGLAASLMLATSYSFMSQARVASLDMMLVMFVTAFIMFFSFGLTASSNQRKKNYYILMHLSCALAVMTKGPVGIFVPWLGVIAYLLWTGRLQEFKNMQWTIAIVVFVVIIAPWLFAVKMRISSSFAVFYHETVTRYTSAFDHQRPFYYFIFRLPLYVLPWGALIPLVIYDMIKSRTVHPYRYPISFFLPAFIFFSLCGSKRSYYLIPLYPFVMLVFCLYLRRSVKIRSLMASVLKKYELKKLIIIAVSLFVLLVCGYISIIPLLNNRNSAVDLCNKLNDIIGANDELLTYRYSRPYIVYYLNSGHVPELNHEHEIQDKLNQSAHGAGKYILLQEKDFSKMTSLEGVEIVLRYPNFTKKDNTMILITSTDKGNMLETR